MGEKQRNSGELLRDTLDMLILKTVNLEPMHGTFVTGCGH